MARYFHHTLPDDQDVSDETLEALLDACVADVQKGLASGGINGPSLYVGAAGIAQACLQAHQALQLSLSPPHQELPSLLCIPPTPPPWHECRARLITQLWQLASEQATAAVDALSQAKAVQSSTAASLLDGAAGAFATATLVFSSPSRTVHPSSRTPLSGVAGAPKCLATYLSLLPKALEGKSDEILYGRAGYLIGATLLQTNLCLPHEPSTASQQQQHASSTPVPLAATTPHQAIHQVAAAILASGRAQAAALDWPGLGSVAKPPLWYTWHHKPYLGAAHGLMGILQALLGCMDAAEEQDPQARDDVRASLEYVLAHERDTPDRPGKGGHYPTQMDVGYSTVSGGEADTGNRPVLVHWCHGAPGAVQLMVKAHEVFAPGAETSKYLEAACRAGELVWEQGLLRKGPGLCHGICGNAYCLLSIYRANHDKRWLRRARQFTAFLGTAGGLGSLSTPDHPASLFEGQAAALPLLAELLSGQPEKARFPVYEI